MSQEHIAHNTASLRAYYADPSTREVIAERNARAQATLAAKRRG